MFHILLNNFAERQKAFWLYTHVILKHSTALPNVHKIMTEYEVYAYDIVFVYRIYIGIYEWRGEIVTSFPLFTTTGRVCTQQFRMQ